MIPSTKASKLKFGAGINAIKIRPRTNDSSAALIGAAAMPSSVANRSAADAEPTVATKAMAVAVRIDVVRMINLPLLLTGKP